MQRFIVYSVLGIFFLACATELPPFIKVCKRSDPEFTQCMMNSVEEIRPYLKSGAPEYNIPSVEPIEIKELINEESLGLKIVSTNVKAYGGGDFVVKDVRIDFDNFEVELDIEIPELNVNSQYAVDGKILMIPIRGHGDFHANLTDCSGTATFYGGLIEKDGNQYLKLDKSKLKIIIGGGKVELENLFGKNEALSAMVNDTINRNLLMFTKELLPFIEKALAQYFLETAQKIVEPYTFDQLFPQ